MSTLGICVVYVVPEGSEWVLDQHLTFIRNTTKNYKIFASLVRVSAEAEQLLRSDPSIEIVDTVPTNVRSSREHAHHLDQLVKHAVHQGCEFVLTLDADSWPIARDWFEQLAPQLHEATPFAAVFRAENRDINLPHPSGFLCRTDFIEAHQPSFWQEKGPDFDEFIAAFRQRLDTGLGYAVKAYANGLDWIRLERSNRHNDHFLMAGIYGDLFFHVGRMSNSIDELTRFYGDWTTTPQRAQIMMQRQELTKTEAGLALWTRVDQEIAAENGVARRRVFSKLRDDPRAYIRLLRGYDDRSLSARIYDSIRGFQRERLTNLTKAVGF